MKTSVESPKDLTTYSVWCFQVLKGCFKNMYLENTGTMQYGFQSSLYYLPHKTFPLILFRWGSSPQRQGGVELIVHCCLLLWGSAGLEAGLLWPTPLPQWNLGSVCICVPVSRMASLEATDLTSLTSSFWKSDRHGCKLLGWSLDLLVVRERCWRLASWKGVYSL